MDTIEEFLDAVYDSDPTRFDLEIEIMMLKKLWLTLEGGIDEDELIVHRLDVRDLLTAPSNDRVIRVDYSLELMGVRAHRIVFARASSSVPV